MSKVFGIVLVSAIALSAAGWQANRFLYRLAGTQYELAFQCEHRGDLVAQWTALRRARILHPLYLRTYFNLGRYYMHHTTNRVAALRAFAFPARFYPESAEAACCRAYVLRVMGEQDEALRNYERAVSIAPDYAEAWYSLGSIQITMKQPDRAVRANLKALEIDPQFADAWQNLGVAYHRLGQDEKAVEADRKAVAIDPKRWAFNFNLGMDLSHKDPQGAEAAYTRAIEIDPSNVESRVELARVHFWSTNQAAGVHELLELEQQYTNAVEPHEVLAEYYYFYHMSKEAGREYAWLAARFPHDATYRGRLAEFSSNKTDVARLQASLRNDIYAGKEPARAQQALGNLLYAKDRRGGIKVLKEAVQKHPSDASLHRDYGKALAMFGEQQQSEKEYLESIRLDPSDTETYQQLALLYEEQRDYARAADAYEHLTDSYSDPVKRERNRTFVKQLRDRSTNCHGFVVFTNCSGQVFRYGVIGPPRNDIIHVGATSRIDIDYAHLGDVYLAMNEPAWAEKAYEAAISSGRYRWALCHATYTLADLYAKEGRFNEGMALYDKLATRWYGDPEIRERAERYRAAATNAP